MSCLLWDVYIRLGHHLSLLKVSYIENSKWNIIMPKNIMTLATFT